MRPRHIAPPSGVIVVLLQIDTVEGATALVPHIGYDRASRVAHHAHAQGIALRRAALEADGVSEAEYDAWVDMRRMSMPG